MASDHDAVDCTLKAYFKALNASDAEACVSLYAKDGVTMAQNFQTQKGVDDILVWYKKTFEAITLSVSVDVKEIIIASDNYAFARTASEGTQKVKQTGETTKESNQELFVLEKVGNEWKIGRYCFCTTNPPKI